jgi:hypothetical protein
MPTFINTGGVWPPKLMKSKMKALSVIHKGTTETERTLNNRNFDYGPLQRIKVHKDTHPKVMKKWIKAFNWHDELQYSGSPSKSRKLHRHEKLKNRIIFAIENHLLRGKKIARKNYIIVDKQLRKPPKLS